MTMRERDDFSGIAKTIGDRKINSNENGQTGINRANSLSDDGYIEENRVSRQ
jgi:hypothetical protein